MRQNAHFQVFVQTSIRVSELCSLTVSDIDVSGRTLTVRSGKGMAARTIELESNGIKAIKSYLSVPPQSLSDHLVLIRMVRRCQSAAYAGWW